MVRGSRRHQCRNAEIDHPRIRCENKGRCRRFESSLLATGRRLSRSTQRRSGATARHGLSMRFDGRRAYIPDLSLVALDEAHGLVGHILFTRIVIGDAERSHDALALAPLAVMPAAQKQGVGSALGEARPRRGRAPRASCRHRARSSGVRPEVRIPAGGRLRRSRAVRGDLRGVHGAGPSAGGLGRRPRRGEISTGVR